MFSLRNNGNLTSRPKHPSTGDMKLYNIFEALWHGTLPSQTVAPERLHAVLQPFLRLLDAVHPAIPTFQRPNELRHMSIEEALTVGFGALLVTLVFFYTVAGGLVFASCAVVLCGTVSIACGVVVLTKQRSTVQIVSAIVLLFPVLPVGFILIMWAGRARMKLQDEATLVQNAWHESSSKAQHDSSVREQAQAEQPPKK